MDVCKKELKRTISEFNREDHYGSDLEKWARSYGRYVRWRSTFKRKNKDDAVSNAEEGFMVGFLYARRLEGY